MLDETLLLDNETDFYADDVILTFIEYLKKMGCTVESYCLGCQHGIDIVATTNAGTKLIVEAKGTPKTHKKNSRLPGMGIAFQSAIGELFQRGHLADPDYRNIVLVPANRRFYNLVKKLNPEQNKKLRLVIALVLPAKDGEDGKVFLTAGGEEMEVQN